MTRASSQWRSRTGRAGGQVFGRDDSDELLERLREIRASERRFHQKIADIYTNIARAGENGPAVRTYCETPGNIRLSEAGRQPIRNPHTPQAAKALAKVEGHSGI